MEGGILNFDPGRSAEEEDGAQDSGPVRSAGEE